MNKTTEDSSFLFPISQNISARWSFPVCIRCVYRSEVREATGIFFVFIGDEENGLFKFVVAEFLKCDSCCDGGEDGDVQFDWKPGRKFHLNKLSQFVEVLKWGYDLQHV